MKVNLSTHMKKVVTMKKMTYPSGSNASKNFTLKKLSKIFNDIASAKDNILEGDSNLKSYIAICQNIEKMFIPYF